jgi:hypothetical protein
MGRMEDETDGSTGPRGVVGFVSYTHQSYLSHGPIFVP